MHLSLCAKLAAKYWKFLDFYVSLLVFGLDFSSMGNKMYLPPLNSS